MQSGTLNRTFDTFNKKKKLNKKEVDELTTEGRNAIESPLRKGFNEVEDYKIKGIEFIVDKSEMKKEEVKLLMEIVMNWMNKILEPKRIIVKNITEDLSDGQILHELTQHFCEAMEVPDVAVSEAAQKQRIKMILDILHDQMNIPEEGISDLKWSVDEIYNGNFAAILCLLVRMIQTFNPEIRLPLNVSIMATKISASDDKLEHTKVQYQVTGMFEGESHYMIDSDSIDTLFVTARDKIDDVIKSLLGFVNLHFQRLQIEVTDIETEFQDGIYLIYLLGILGNFYIPQYSYNLPASEYSQKRENVLFAYDLMEELGMMRVKSSPDEVIIGDLKGTLRVLYVIYSFFKDSI